MARKNQKHMLPRIPGGVPSSLSRGAFLDGTLKTYFAPGQSSASTDRALGYRPPDDWPAAGTLLRVPQVAWLAIGYPDDNPPLVEELYSGPCLYYSYNYTRTADGQPFSVWVWTDGHQEQVGSPLFGQGSYVNMYIKVDVTPTPGGFSVSILLNSFPSPTNTVPQFDALGSFAYRESLASPWGAARGRVVAAFAEARDRLEAIRPGRTWPVVFDYAVPPARGDGFGYAGLAAPGADESFFGTRFLQVTAGVAARHGFAPPPATAADPPEDFAADLEAAAAAAPAFASYGTAFYGPAGDFPTFPPTPATPTIPPAPTSVEVDGQTRGTVVATEPAALMAAYDAFRDRVATRNAELAAINASYRDRYQEAAAALPDGVAWYAGDDGALTGAAVVALIADHFGFDPDTGADLG